jgi:hypothetical protein
MGNNKENNEENISCKPVVNGFLCDVSESQLEKFQYDHGLNSQIIEENNRTKIIVFDSNGNQVGLAFKNGDSGLRFFSKKRML